MPTVKTAQHRRMEAVLPALRTIHRKYAARVARQATLLHLTAKKLDAEGRAAAGRAYKDWHEVGYDMHGLLVVQAERGEIPVGAGIVYLVDTTREIASYAGRVAAERGAPALPSE